MEKNLTIRDEYSEYLKSMDQRLKRIQERILEVKELFGATVNRTTQIKYLESLEAEI